MRPGLERMLRGVIDEHEETEALRPGRRQHRVG